MDHIPIVDFSKTEKLTLAQELTNAVKSHGFVYLKNFGISNEKISHMFETSKTFFNSDLEVKLTAAKDHVTFCGYDEIEKEKLSHDRPGDLKESFMLKQIGTPWPVLNDSGVFKNQLLDFHAECSSLAFKLVRTLAIGLGLEENIFDQNFNGECTVLRLIHYPPTLKPILPNQLRCGEHSDYGALTILFQDPAGGLEIKTRQDEWLPAPYIPNTVIINIGDCMEMWTNGFLKSTPHRVVNPQIEKMGMPRYSTAFFFDPNLDCELKCFKKFEEVNDTKFTSKTYKNHVFKIFDETYPESDHFKEKI